MVGLSVAVVFFGASAAIVPATAAADQIGTTRAQVTALQAQVVASAGRVRDLTLAYEEANTRAGALAQQVSTDQVELAALQQRENSTRVALRQEAILGYTGASVDVTTSGGPGSVAAGSVTNDPAIRAEYLQVASGDMSETVDAYRTQAAQLATAQAQLAAEMRAASSAAALTDSARQQALTQAAAVQGQLQDVQGRLTQLLSAQAAAQAAAAARAATQGMPVNNGLVSVVRTVVAPSPAPAASAGAGGVWLQLRECESGDNYQANTGNGFFGAYQFSESTWTGMGYPGRPDLEPPAMQDQAAQRLQAESGWGQWPACSAALGLH